MADNNIQAIDLVVVNLYPFAATVANPDCTLPDAIENIDIGGPTMVRAAAKNHNDVTIVVNASDYAHVLQQMSDNNGAVDHATRFDLAIKAFEHTAEYDGMIANYFGARLESANCDDDCGHEHSEFPRTYNIQVSKKQDLRYGENAHQSAAFYVENDIQEASVATAEQLQGKELSFNNIADTDSALECVKEFAEPACVIVKHANPCGVALGDDILAAYNRAYQTDPTSAFGGIIAFNRELDANTAQAIIDRQFVEVIIAPTVSKEAQTVLSAKQNVRVLECGDWQGQLTDGFDFKRVNGGLLIQERDFGMVELDDLTVVTKVKPTEAQLQDLLFTWKVAKYVKSNAIVYCKDGMTIGVGAGQMSRVYSAKIAGNIDENLKEIIRNKISSLKNTQYLGVVKGIEKRELLNWSTIFVLPTFYKMEGQPISILEALATSNVIISTKHAGIPDIIKHEKNGFLMETNKVDELVEFFTYLDENRSKIKQISEYNKTYFINNFTVDIFESEFLKAPQPGRCLPQPLL